MNQLQSLQEETWAFYAAHGRELPWRQADADGSYDPYKILVSELMLQQTQVARVVPKYHEFLVRFPDVQTLASAQLGDVLRLWSGLGYNRRAKFLWQAAQACLEKFNGVLPADQKQLTELPGVGLNTAGAICAYTFNMPVVFIETNIRTVFIHHLFPDRDQVHDNELLPLVGQALDTENPREWYWALMDYGSHIKATHGNASRASAHHVKQSTFVGSKRQVRGQVLRVLGQGSQSLADLQKTIQDTRLEAILADLVGEGLIRHSGQDYSL